jgi:hypothetical protein
MLATHSSSNQMTNINLEILDFKDVILPLLDENDMTITSSSLPNSF